MEAVFDFKEFISGDKSIDDVTEHLLGITTSEGRNFFPNQGRS
jgi:hypothetical protein